MEIECLTFRMKNCTLKQVGHTDDVYLMCVCNIHRLFYDRNSRVETRVSDKARVSV